MRRFWKLVLGGLIGGALASCAGADSPPASEPVLQTLPSVTPTAQATLTPTPPLRPEPTPAGPRRLTIWLPDSIAPPDNPEAAVQREVWASALEALEENLTVTFRLKRPADVGGMFQTLRSASLVAPSSIPDLALLRRGDLLAAVTLGLIQPIGSAAFSVPIQDLRPAEVALGSVDGDLYALPFTIDVSHLALGPQQEMAGSESDWTFEAVLEREISFRFPAGRTGIASETFLAQYRAAAGAFNTDAMPVDAEALEAVYRFYEEALAAGIVPANVLDYAASSDYIDQVLSGAVTAGVLSSTTYLTLRDSGTVLDYAPLPTLDGVPTTLVDGWMWVITTSDADRQEHALQFLNWVFDVDRHATYARTIHMLPSGQSTLRQSADEDYATFVASLIANASLPVSDAAGGVIGRAMQNGLAAVLRGERTAEIAAQDVIDQVG
ncbi:MAG: extracellular solute-binding protein [Chloroflexi bacterium]|nr:extracellular solute-binding protein [Chloroflexota bacterium]